MKSRLIGKIKPKGWIKEFMDQELTKGFTGHLEDLVPDLFKDDIYDKNRLSKTSKPKDLGTVENDDSWNIQFYWWNSETQSNYYDGLLRHAFLLNNQSKIDKVKILIGKKLKSQDEDDYLGIYDKDLRYNFEGENGELWSKTTLYRYLLAYYYYTNDKTVLEVVIRATKNVMNNYKINQSTPFKNKDGFAGLTHGLMFTDICFQLYEITNNKEYLDYAKFLYEDYNKHEVSEPDIQSENLLNKDYTFWGHGVHTYEHLRALLVANIDNDFNDELIGYYNKLSKVISPSGGPIGDEWVMNNTVDSDLHGYEYCSIHELMDSLIYHTLINDDSYIYLIENIFLNASFGSRHPNKSSIAYLKSDNSYSMEGEFQIKQEHSPHQKQTRYKYSPTHKDAAVCCVPNATRIIPYYIENQWFIEDDNLYLNYYLPTELNFKHNDIDITISQITDYPNSNHIKLEITSSSKTDLTIHLPNKKGTIMLNNSETTNIVNHTFSKDVIDIDLTFDIKLHKDLQDRTYLKYGPLLYVLPIEAKEYIVKDYSNNQFKDVHVKPVGNVDDIIIDESRLKDIKYHNTEDKMFNSFLKVPVLIENKKDTLTFIPFGRSILRKTTF